MPEDRRRGGRGNRLGLGRELIAGGLESMQVEFDIATLSAQENREAFGIEPVHDAREAQ